MRITGGLLGSTAGGVMERGGGLKSRTQAREASVRTNKARARRFMSNSPNQLKNAVCRMAFLS
jgi:hypothetical protein